MKEPCYNCLNCGVFFFFFFLISFYLLIQCTSRPVDPVSPRVVHWGYEAVGRALAGHFALANWPLGAVLLVKSTWSMKKSTCCLCWCFILWSSCCRFVASTSDTTAEVLFRCERSGHFQVGSQKRFLNWTRKFHRELRQFTQRIFNCIELGKSAIFHRFPAVYPVLKLLIYCRYIHNI